MTAAPSLNLSYIGIGPSAGNQIVNNGLGGPASKTLYGYGVITNGNTTTAANAAPVGFIDGVQGFGKTIVLAFQSVAAPVTLNGTANQAFYATVAGASQLAVGQSITFTGFTNSANNVTATINTVTATGVYVTNSSAVAEVNPAGSGVVQVNNVPVFVDVFVAGNSGDTTAVITAALNGGSAFYPTALSATGFTLNWSAWATTAQTLHFGAIIGFSN